MKHIIFAVAAAAVLAVVGPRISQEQPKEAAVPAPHELFAPNDYRAVTPNSHAAPELSSLHIKR